jgi:flagellar hook-basal body complex protein FliE
MNPLSITVTPSAAAGAYRATDTGDSAVQGTDPAAFGAALQRAIEGAVDAGHAADAQSMQAIAGGGNITEVVTAVSKAQLALQSTVAIRDRVVQAYQEIMRMAI